MATISFPTRQDAVAAGYKLGPNGRAYVAETHGTIDIFVTDDGLEYSIGGDRQLVVRTVSVYLKEEINKLKQPGCYFEMFAPGDYEQGVEAARKAMPKARAEHIKSFMNGEYTKGLLSVSEVEKRAAIPQNTLRNFLNGQRGLPEQHVAPIEGILEKLGLKGYSGWY